LRTSPGPQFPWTAVRAAALANGTCVATLTYYDNARRGLVHFGGPHSAALLAVAELRAASGAALLEAHAIAFEAAYKLGRGLQPGQYLAGPSAPVPRAF
jgi:2-methylcitrate dehydratase PrpD